MSAYEELADDLLRLCETWQSDTAFGTDPSAKAEGIEHCRAGLLKVLFEHRGKPPTEDY